MLNLPMRSLSWERRWLLILPMWLIAFVCTICPADETSLAGASMAAGEDWPMWRCDAQRSGASSNTLPTEYNLLWQREFSPRTQAWDDPLNLDLMTYDRVFEPVVLDGRLFVGFNDADKLVALDAETGRELWTYFTEAPVRLPPVGWRDRVFFSSDDGRLYCAAAETGKLLWRFDAAPNRQHALGNKRLVSSWPARGGPVVRDGCVYFAAGIWPFMGTFIYALDADSGKVKWLNDSTGAQYIKQPHSAPSFAGVAPQGALVATADSLIVPGGRSVPAVFDRTDGRLKYFELNAGGKGTGGSWVAADNVNFYLHTRLKGTRAFNLKTGVKTAFQPNEPVLAGGFVYSAEVEDSVPLIRAYGTDEQKKWEIAVDGTGDLISAKGYLLAAGGGTISVVALPTKDQPARVVSSFPVEGDVQRLLVADRKLFAVTLDGRIQAFGSAASQPAAPIEQSTASTQRLPTADDRFEVDPKVEAEVRDLLKEYAAEGYAYWFGRADDPRLQALVTATPFAQLAVIDQDLARVDRMRSSLDRAGVYGRVTAHLSSPRNFLAPKYTGSLIFVSSELSGNLAAPELKQIYETVRPYGGVLHLFADRPEQLAKRIQLEQLEQAEIEILENSVVIRRVGALPGSADWTHQYGNVANTIKSNDRRVKLPLGVLWFGGSSNMDVLPRHGHGPPEQVVGGRLFIQGMNSLSARDVYTGRILWKREFADLGTHDVYYDDTYENVPLDPKYNQVHIPGANGRGTNYVVTADRVYIVEGNLCHVLDPATGETLHDIHLPKGPGNEDGSAQWGYVGVYEDVLLGGMGFARYRERNQLTFEADKELKSSKAGFGSKSLDRAASLGLVAFDRHTGKQLWRVDATHSFWHNGIVAGGGRVYCLDRNPQQVEDALRRRGMAIPNTYRILALDYRSGKLQWEVTEDIFGTWLGYSEEFDRLLQAGAKGSDRLADEVGQGMAVYAGSDGSLQWKNESVDYAGPCILHNDLIITNANSYTESAGAFYLTTGKQKMTKHPLTGEIQPWKITRAYGCNNIVASENMLTFRSGAAGFYDLLTDAGTGNLGGFKSGCTSNLIVANGVLNAPDYTRTCSCSYQNQTSLALVPMPEMDAWSVNTAAIGDAQAGRRLTSLALNFGAPGDRRDASGTLWLEFPTVSEPAPPLAVELNAEAEPFQFHTSSMAEHDNAWILASGIERLTDLKIGLALAGENPADGRENLVERRFDVKLHMAVPPRLQAGARSVDIYAGEVCLAQDLKLNPSGAETVFEFHDVPAKELLHLRFVPKQGHAILNGIEIVESEKSAHRS